MDIFSHGLWGGAYAKVLNRRTAQKDARPLRPLAAAFWGIFPDLVAFGPAFIWLAWALATGEHSFSDFPFRRPPQNGAFQQYPAFQLAHDIYNFSHSAVIFSIVLTGVLVARRTLFPKIDSRTPWEMGGWLVHILMDIPTHTARFYPTPVFWPISDWKFLNGFSWGEPWFMALNYAVLALIYYFLRRKRAA